MPPTKSSKGSSTNCEDTDVESLINRVCTSFVHQLESRIDQKLDKLGEKLNEVTNSIKLLNNTVNTNSKAIKDFEEKCDIIEQYAKKNSLRFLGVAGGNDEVLVDVVTSLISNTLKVPCTKQDIDCAFRIGKHSNAEKPPPILVNFISNIKRAQVFNSKKLLKSTNISIHEDLTHRRYELLKAAKKRYGVGKVWSANGKIFLLKGNGNEKIQINSLSDL